jgi:cytochrome c oxidase subunit IV
VKRRLARAAPYALLLAIAAGLYVKAAHIEYTGPEGRIGPDFWPRAILTLLAAVCVYELAKSLLVAGAQSAGGMLQNLMDAAAGTDAEPRPQPSSTRLALGIGATLGYVLLVDVLGFFVSTAAFLFAFILVGGYRRAGVAAVCALAGSLAMVVVFMKVVYISLPLGAGPFRAVSVGLLALLGVR